MQTCTSSSVQQACTLQRTFVTKQGKALTYGTLLQVGFLAGQSKQTCTEETLHINRVVGNTSDERCMIMRIHEASARNVVYLVLWPAPHLAEQGVTVQCFCHGLGVLQVCKVKQSTRQPRSKQQDLHNSHTQCKPTVTALCTAYKHAYAVESEIEPLGNFSARWQRSPAVRRSNEAMSWFKPDVSHGISLICIFGL